jgi:hypothetical protein
MSGDCLPSLGPYWRVWLFVLALTLASTGVSLFVPYLYRGLVDKR